MASATVVTRKGKEIIASRMRGSTPTQAEPLNLCWGLNAAGVDTYNAAATDVALFQESTQEARVAGTSSIVTVTNTNDTYQVTGTMTCATAPKAICEAALADSTTQPAQGAVAAAGVVGSSSATTLNTAATFSPGNGNDIQIRTEVMNVVSGSGTSALTVTRGVNGSAAIATIAVGDVVTPGNAPGSTGVTGGSLLTHADFAPINLNVGDSIAFTWKVQMT